MEPKKDIEIPPIKEWWVFFKWYSKWILKITAVWALVVYLLIPINHKSPSPHLDHFLLTLIPAFLAYIFFMILFIRGFQASTYLAASGKERVRWRDYYWYFAVILAIILIKAIIESI